jgi:hypothetical protein
MSVVQEGNEESTPEQRIRDLYGFSFPVEFFQFRKFLAGLPAGILAHACDMRPAFPFDVADGRTSTTFPDNPLWEDRYYNDLPEFITLFNGSIDGLHFGYYFDAPGELPPLVVHYWHSDAYQHSIDADGLFEATRSQVEQAESDNLEMAEEPDEAADCHERLAVLAVIRAHLSVYWGGDRSETGDEYLERYGDEESWREPVANTWDDIGIVVAESQFEPLSSDPFGGDRLDVERPEIENLTAQAMQMLRDGRPGAALKLGRDLWVRAGDFPECYELLDAAYAALRRDPLRRLLAAARAWREHCDAGRKPVL